jgi:hypothetical protein
MRPVGHILPPNGDDKITMKIQTVVFMPAIQAVDNGRETGLTTRKQGS